MKYIQIYLVSMLILLSGVITAQGVEVDTKASTIEWLGKKVGSEHYGFIGIKNAVLELDGINIVGGEVVVDMTSITNTDVGVKMLNKKLVGHLKSDDFFGVESYPTATFKITEASAFDGNKAILKGDITIKGKTEPIIFTVNKEGNAYATKIDIDRSKFDVKYGSKTFFDDVGDKAIDDIFTLDIKLVIK